MRKPTFSEQLAVAGLLLKTPTDAVTHLPSKQRFRGYGRLISEDAVNRVFAIIVPYIDGGDRPVRTEPETRPNPLMNAVVNAVQIILPVKPKPRQSDVQPLDLDSTLF